MVLPLLWGLLAGCALVLSWATALASFAWVGYVMLTALALGVAAARLGERGLVAERRLSADRIALAGRVEVEVTVENRSRLPVLWVSAAETLPAGLPMTGVRGRVGPLAGRGKFRFRYTLEGARRGYYQIGPTLLRTGDLFGLSTRERVRESASLTVFPKIVAVTHARLPSRRSVGDVRARYRVLEDPVRVIGIRPHQHSDGLRRVHWRATAHTGKLQSKLYDVSAQMETVLALNLRRSDYPASPEEAAETAELAIVVAASLAHHVLERRQRVGLVAVARDQAAGAALPSPAQQLFRQAASRNREQLAAILSALGRMALGPTEDLAGVLNQDKESLAWGSLVVVITPGVGEELLRALLSMRQSGFDVEVVLVGRTPTVSAGPSFGEHAMGISSTRVRSEADIRGLGL